MTRTQHDLPTSGTLGALPGLLLWLRQGRPREMPLVIAPGRAIIREDGMMTLVGWTLSFHFTRRTFDLTPGSDDVDRLWEYLVAKGYAKVEWMGADQWQTMRASQT